MPGANYQVQNIRYQVHHLVKDMKGVLDRVLRCEASTMLEQIPGTMCKYKGPDIRYLGPGINRKPQKVPGNNKYQVPGVNTTWSKT